MKKKQVFINLVANIISFVIHLGISFLLTPVLIKKVGNSAYGFIGLANNFVSYANIFTIVINSMTSRFITYETARNNSEQANKYYSSVFFVNMVMSILMTIASIVMIINLNSILSIPEEIYFDVKMTFALSFANFVLSLIGSVFGMVTFIKNRLEISAIVSIIGNIIKTVILILLFNLLPAKIYYIPLVALIIAIYSIIVNIRITKKIAPNLNYNFNMVDKKCVIKLSKAGIWNALNSMSRILLTGLDLLIANLTVGADAMGILSVAKTVPNNIEGLLATISGSFTPQFIVLYSKHKIRELVEAVNFSLKLLGVMMIVPMAGFIVCGFEFFSLWMPFKTSEEILQIQILSILSVAPYIVSMNNFTLSSLDSVTNKLKRPVIVTIVMSIVSTITTLIFLNITNLGIYAIAGVSSVYWIMKVALFNTINAAVNLRIKWYSFFKSFLKNLLCFTIVMLLFSIIKRYLVFDSWKMLILSVGVLGIIGYIFSFFFLLSRKERKSVYFKMCDKLKLFNHNKTKEEFK